MRRPSVDVVKARRLSVGAGLGSSRMISGHLGRAPRLPGLLALLSRRAEPLERLAWVEAGESVVGRLRHGNLNSNQSYSIFALHQLT